MIKLLLPLILSSQLLLCATSKQVESYLTLSNAEEELISLEAGFSSMQSSFSQSSDGNTTTYDMQLLSIRFRDFLERNLSEDEMDEILENYRHVVLLQFVNASQIDADRNTSKAYITKLKDNPEESNRVSLVTEISNNLYSKEAMDIMFDGLMKPLLTNGKGKNAIDKEFIKDSQDSYVKRSMQSALNETLFITKEFTIQELEELLVIAKTSASNHEVKAVYGALSYALQDFFISIASRYDISKHQPKHTKETKDTK
jgi:hypothetical protein